MKILALALGCTVVGLGGPRSCAAAGTPAGGPRCCAAADAMSVAQERDPPLVDLVTPLMGTDNTKELSCGNLYPAICRPWGMNVWTPQTGKMGNGWIYLSP